MGFFVLQNPSIMSNQVEIKKKLVQSVAQVRQAFQEKHVRILRLKQEVSINNILKYNVTVIYCVELKRIKWTGCFALKLPYNIPQLFVIVKCSCYLACCIFLKKSVIHILLKLKQCCFLLQYVQRGTVPNALNKYMDELSVVLKSTGEYITRLSSVSNTRTYFRYINMFVSYVLIIQPQNLMIQFHT